MTMLQQVRQCGLPAQGGPGNKGAAQAGNIPRQQVLPHSGGRCLGVLPVEQNIVPHLDADEFVRVSGLQVQIFVNIGGEFRFGLDNGRGFRLLRHTRPGGFRYSFRRRGCLRTGPRLFRLQMVLSGCVPLRFACFAHDGKTAIVQIPFKLFSEHFNGFLIQVGKCVKHIALIDTADIGENVRPILRNVVNSIANLILVPARRTPDCRFVFLLL